MNLGRGLIASAVCAVALSSAAYTEYAAKRVVKLPSDIEFTGLPGDLPTVHLYGDPNQPGPFVTRVKIPAGTKVLPHWNPDVAHTVTVLSGTFYYAIGEKWDETKLAAYPAGAFIAEPAKTSHFEWAKDGEVVLQITGIGPTGAIAVQPQNQ